MKNNNSSSIIFGEIPGDKCNRNYCNGTIEKFDEDSSCRCHCGMPPCSHCTDDRIKCNECHYDNT